MKKFKVPKNYKSKLTLNETQRGIKVIKDFFQQALAYELNLLRVSAPAFVEKNSGLNDNLSGVERPVSFDIKDSKEIEGEVVHSLAKWKRLALSRYGFKEGEGIYTDMVAIRRDEELDNIHSIYVDQWDWEKIINKKDRTNEYLERLVCRIYSAIRKTEKHLLSEFDLGKAFLPENITFITSEELLQKYPKNTPKEREYKICKEYGAVFIKQIGKYLSNGERHDGRAPDYDDWELNGDILVYYPVLDIALELSSMGIRVDEKSMKEQLKISKCEDRAKLPFQKMVLEKKLPYTIGGGVGQSRLCMFFLRKAHIGEIHCSLWTKEVYAEAKKNGILLL